MLDTHVLQKVLSTIPGQIGRCRELVAEGHCNWDCCTYTDSYLLFLPGEWESANQLGYDLTHYHILDDNFHRGVKAVPRSMGCCVAPSQGENLYKSIDCRLYPYWFQINETAQLIIMQGDLCPLVRRREGITAHRNSVLSVFDLIKGDPDVIGFLTKARMVGYSVSHSE